MKDRLLRILRRLAEWALKTQRYRILRAHLWDDAVHEMKCRSC